MSFEQSGAGYESAGATRAFENTAGSDVRVPTNSGAALDDETSRRLDAALHSPYGVDKLLNRLKQSIFSTREFSAFLRERCALEDRHAQGYKKLVRNTSESLRRAEARQGSYARNLTETMQLNERLAENGLTFASALHTMSEELRDVADNAERGRKQWKHSFMDAEKRLYEAESAQQKAKDRYNSAAEQYDRARTGEKAGGKFSLKNKNPQQQEEFLKEKADTLDKEYAAKFEAAQSQRMDFEGKTRRQIVSAFRELIDECDAAVAMQMAKLASISEKHIVSNGTAIAPIKAADSDVEPRGLRHIARDMDDRKDFADYMLDGAEPPPQFKGRSRRNTDVDLVHSVQTPSAQRTDTNETPYTPSQSHVESRPPQLPQIGGSDSFSRSFEADRPVPQNNRNSYFGGQSDALNSHPTHQTQQTGVTNELAPSLSNTRAPIAPSLPSYDRGQAPTPDQYSNNNNNGFGRAQGPPRQGTMPTVVGVGRPSMDNQYQDRTLGPARQGTMPVAGGRGQNTMEDQYTDRNQAGSAQSALPSFAGRGRGVGVDPVSNRGQADTGHSGMPGGFPDPNQRVDRQEHIPTTTDRVINSMDKPSETRELGNRGPGNMSSQAGRGPNVAGALLSGHNQGPQRQDTIPSTGPGSQYPVGRENPYMETNQDSAPPTIAKDQSPNYQNNKQDSTLSTGGRDHMAIGRENPYMNNKQEPIMSTSGRNELPVGRENPYMGNNQGSSVGDRGQVSQVPVGRENPYMNDGHDHNRGLAQNLAGAAVLGTGTHRSPTEESGFGRSQGVQGLSSAGRGGSTLGQGTQGITSAGRGGPGAAGALLPSQQQHAQQRPMLPPTRPVFGMSLDELFRRDGSAVPIIVFQCIQAVDMFGLSTQGIYRVSGSSPTVQQLKSEFDHDSSKVDLTNREIFNNDIATVATLLKNFLRDLPDPLLTSTAYHSFIQAARYENDVMRRDTLHQYINSLPDPNYATLRVLTLHLHRVSVNSDVNKMDMRNLAVVFGPTLMGGSNLADAGLQTKVMETILHHTHDIFDPDE